ncbi:MAG: DUF2061 domain-containing protein [Phycisphaerae bacterium]|nr:DUF2061 domain-containing protein [Phycisphaerae bacterium]
MESHIRTVAKSLTWRVAAWGITTTVAWVVTGNGELAATIGLGDTVIKLVAYYAHERAWLKSGFGNLKQPANSIPRGQYEVQNVPTK